MLVLAKVATAVAILTSIVDAQLFATRTTSITSTNTVYKCGCVSPTALFPRPIGIGILVVTTTIGRSSTFACGCTSSRLVSTSRSTTLRTTSTSTRSTSSTAPITSTSASITSSSSSPNSSSSTSGSSSSPGPLLSTGTSTSATSSSSSSSSSGSATPSPPANIPAVVPAINNTSNSASFQGRTVRNTILILARNNNDAYNAYSGLQGYGIPYEVLLVPRDGVVLPTLNSSATAGNYGGFITVSELSYQTASGGWASGLTDEQFTAIYDYQKTFGVRMTRLDTYPWSAFGAVALGTTGGCCDYGVEQLISFSNTSGFPTANLKQGAGMSTKAIWHYPARITDPMTTWEIASYEASSNGQYPDKTTAAVINDFSGRQQMVFFTGWATEWSATSAFLQHAYIHWMTRGLFVGSRKVYMNAQIDDVHLRTQIYAPTTDNFYRSIPRDYQMHADWQLALNPRLPAGSNFFLELGHNGNGDIIASTNNTIDGPTLCNPNAAIYYINNDFSTLEFQKPLGSGKSVWPNTPTNYTWSLACASIDDLARWFMNPVNLNNFAHISHTFTHLHQNNATFADIDREIFFNQQWMSAIGIANATRFSPKGLIPPAITGMHNGDAIRAWITNGLTSAVGDNSRPVLVNRVSGYWPYITTVESNGFDGMTVIPRWPTKIYYDCDTPYCTTQEWTVLFGGNGRFDDLMASEKSITTRYLMSLRHDPYMFHQANMRANDASILTVGTQTGQFSLVQIWIETVTQEMSRLTNWPIVSLKQDDLAVRFTERLARDNCQPNLLYQYSDDGKSITGISVTANGNTCSAPIGVTFPGQAIGGSATDDQVGSEPLIKWVRLGGSAQSFTLAQPVPIKA